MPIQTLNALKKKFSGLNAQPAEAPITFAHSNPSFEIIALGARSGVLDGNMSSYMIRPLGTNEAVLCDAGTLGNGLKRAEKKHILNDIPVDLDTSLTRAGLVLRQTIRAYLISHAHLDHVAGLVLSSPDDTAKPIYAFPQTREILSEHLFNNRVWGNMGNQGAEPHIGKYHYKDMTPGQTERITHTQLDITAWPLAHGNTTSTAFLIKHNDHAVLYMGDIEANTEEGKAHLNTVWQAIAPLVKEGKLKAIIMEATYPDDRADNALFGHMRPKDLLQALRDLGHECGGRHYIRGLQVLVTHVKETFESNTDNTRKIYHNLQDGNDIGIHFIMAEQSARYLV